MCVYIYIWWACQIYLMQFMHVIVLVTLNFIFLNKMLTPFKNVRSVPEIVLFVQKKWGMQDILL